MIIKNSLELSHEYIEKAAGKGDIVIDATAGNGKDTVFLASLVGSEGLVYAFDIQDSAIHNTRKLLQQKDLTEHVKLIKDRHENMNFYINEKVKAVMFNLGYLPYGNHNIATTPQTTIRGLKNAMRLLQVNGLITIVIYHGGDTGFKEKEKVLEFTETIDYNEFSVIKTDFINQINCPPILVCLEKLK